VYTLRCLDYGLRSSLRELVLPTLLRYAFDNCPRPSTEGSPDCPPELVMKEIIYVQAGNTSNHIGTHFWNTQQSYFTYSEDKEVLVDHDVSFREGVSPRVCN
jgi:hypothetical protein